jgi:hypothetical protein
VSDIVWPHLQNRHFFNLLIRIFENNVVNAPFIPLFEFVGLDNDPLFGGPDFDLENAENGNGLQPMNLGPGGALMDLDPVDEVPGPGFVHQPQDQPPEAHPANIDIPDPQIALMEVIAHDFHNQCVVM